MGISYSPQPAESEDLEAPGGLGFMRGVEVDPQIASTDFVLPLSIRNRRVNSDEDATSEGLSDGSHEDAALSAWDLDKPARNPVYTEIVMWAVDDCQCTDNLMRTTFGETIDELADFIGAAEALAVATAPKLSLQVWKEEWHRRSGDYHTTWTRVDFARACAHHWIPRCGAFEEWRASMGVSYRPKLAVVQLQKSVPRGKSKRHECSGRMRPIKVRKAATPSA